MVRVPQQVVAFYGDAAGEPEAERSAGGSRVKENSSLWIAAFSGREKAECIRCFLRVHPAEEKGFLKEVHTVLQFF